MVAQHHESGADLTVGLARVSDPIEYGGAVLDDHGRLIRLVEKPSWGAVVSGACASATAWDETAGSGATVVCAGRCACSRSRMASWRATAAAVAFSSGASIAGAGTAGTAVAIGAGSPGAAAVAAALAHGGWSGRLKP